MDKKKLLRRVLGLVLAAVMVLPLTGPGMLIDASAVTQAEIDALKNNASNLASQKKDIQNQLKAVKADKSAAMQKKQLLEDQIDVIRQEIANINEQIAMYDQLIAEKTAELEQAEADEQAQFDLFCRRMRYMEEQGEVSYWSILFASNDFSELLDNYMMIEEIIQYDNQVIDDLTALQEKVTNDRTALERPPGGRPGRAEGPGGRGGQAHRPDQRPGGPAGGDGGGAEQGGQGPGQPDQGQGAGVRRPDRQGAQRVGLPLASAGQL